jgi:hypothetical protein
MSVTNAVNSNHPDFFKLSIDPYYYKKSPYVFSLWDKITSKFNNFADWFIDGQEQDKLENLLATKKLTHYQTLANSSANSIQVEENKLISQIIDLQSKKEIHRKNFFILALFSSAFVALLCKFPKQPFSLGLYKSLFFNLSASLIVFSAGSLLLLLRSLLELLYNFLKMGLTLAGKTVPELNNEENKKKDNLEHMDVLYPVGLAPIIEEPIFRFLIPTILSYGLFFFTGLNPFLIDKIICVASSFIFGIAHIGQYSFFQTMRIFVTSCFIEYPLSKRYGLMASIGAHMGNNYVVLLNKFFDNLTKNIHTKIFGDSKAKSASA